MSGRSLTSDVGGLTLSGLLRNPLMRLRRVGWGGRPLAGSRTGVCSYARLFGSLLSRGCNLTPANPR